MKSFLFITFLLTFVSCKETKHSDKQLLRTELKYSTYGWFFDEQGDSLNFFLVHYMNIAKNGHFTSMLKNALKGKPMYFSGSINDSTCNLINVILNAQTYKSDYTPNANDSYIYDGYTYTLDFTDNNDRRKLIHYMPIKCPAPIKKLNELLDSLIFSTNKQKIDTLFIDKYEKELKNISWTMEKPQKVYIDKKRFVPPKIIK